MLRHCKKNLFLVFALAAGLFLTAGCFEVDEKVSLNKDLSGSLSLSVTYDMNIFIEGVADFQAKMAQNQGKAFDKEAAKKKMREKMKSQSKEKQKEMPSLKEMQESAPKGITLKKVDMSMKDLKMNMSLDLEFDHLNTLKKLNLDELGQKKSPKGRRKQMNPTKKFFDTQDPFKGLTVKEEGNKITIEMPIYEGKKKNKRPRGPMPSDTEKYFKNMGLNFSFAIPEGLKIVEHNATKTEGKTLIWDYNLKKLTELEDKGEAATVKIVLEK